MKSKFLIILVLISLLIFTIYRMMKHEESIREERIITNYVEDESKPLIEKLDFEEIQNLAANVKYNFKSISQYFEKYNSGNDDIDESWESIFLAGVNLGVAVPGKFPAEFSLTFDQYLHWIKLIGKMNANVIRVYTILPPEFYDAVSYYNLIHHNKPVYIMQGVWAKVPDDHDYFNTDFTRDFQKEIIDVIDVVHGNAVLNEKPGKASGVYSTDISKYIIGFLLGREWEPSSVSNTIHKNSISHYDGNFISVPDGNPMEIWLAKMMDYAATYETQTYSWQHPLSFVNWLPLDPMFHNTEFIENTKVKEYDNDLISVDFEKFYPTDLFQPGIYAAYHVYPYYPDYVFLQENYAVAKNHRGETDNFFGYLSDLIQNTKGMPLVIAEYGLPSSRGNSHFTPLGLNQGGHSEKDQAELSLLLTEDIYETGCAGAIYFEWADEWFKHNWLVMDFENPFHDRKLWHNMENPEQNFGILALEDKIVTVDGLLKDWENFDDTDQIEVQSNSDATYFYLAAKLPYLDFKKHNLYIAIDTYDSDKGDHKLPFSDNLFDIGFEFLCAFNNKNQAKILVDEPYSVFTDVYNDYIPVYASVYNENGSFIDELMLVNRSREDLLGNKQDSIVTNRGQLIFGNSANAESSNADWYWSKNDSNFELRLNWHLINVSDPAKKFVLDDLSQTKAIEVSNTEGFNIFLFITDKNNNIITQYPEDEPFFYTWQNWDMPVYSERLKPIYDTLKNYFKNLVPKKDANIIKDVEDESFEIANFYNDKKAAVSITFDNAGYSQYEYALPILVKYNMAANFSIIPDILEEISSSVDMDEGTKIKRMGNSHYREILSYGNEIALQTEDSTIQHNNLTIPRINHELRVLHLHNADSKVLNIPNQVLFVRNPAGSKSMAEYNNIPYSILNTNISQLELDSILNSHKNKWNILVYKHIYKDTTEIKNLKKEVVESSFIKYDDFKKQMRLIRNSNYWIANESEIFKYITERDNSKIEVNNYENLVFVKLKNNLDPFIFDQPITIRYRTNAKIIKVTGSAKDGVYTNRTQSILLCVYPNKKVKIEIVQTH